MTDRTYAAGVDLGGTFLKLALLDDGGAVVARETVPTAAADGPAEVLRRMAEGVRRLADATPAGSVGSLGVGVPARVEGEGGEVHDAYNLPGPWGGTAVGAIMARATGLPTRVLNDARAFAVAEQALGAAAGATTALLATVGTGIGGAVIADGRVVFGLGGTAGEIGHVVVRAGGPRCTCGNRGCAEPLASGPAIAAEAVRRILQGFTTEMGRLAGGDLNAITPELVARAAAAGDAEATEVLEDAGAALGLALAGGIALVAPEVVVVGGGVARPDGVYWRAAEATARAHARVTPIDRIAFRPAALGYDAGVIGAALWGRGLTNRDATTGPAT